MPIEALLAAATILLIGGLNWFGPTKTGTIAMFIALATVALTLVIGGRALLHVTGALPVAGLGGVHLAIGIPMWAIGASRAHAFVSPTTRMAFQEMRPAPELAPTPATVSWAF